MGSPVSSMDQPMRAKAATASRITRTPKTVRATLRVGSGFFAGKVMRLMAGASARFAVGAVAALSASMAG